MPRADPASTKGIDYAVELDDRDKRAIAGITCNDIDITERTVS